MQSFKSFCQKIEENSDHHETGAVKAIRNGLGINKSFWDDFMLLLNNAEAVADLLRLPPEKVGTWSELVKNSLKKVHEADNEIVPKDKKRLLKTGLPEGT